MYIYGLYSNKLGLKTYRCTAFSNIYILCIYIYIYIYVYMYVYIYNIYVLYILIYNIA